MSRWPMVPLGEVTSVTGGSTPASKESSYWDGDVPWITPAEMGNLESPYVSLTRRTLTAAGLASCSAKLLPVRSVILSSRAPIGYVVINEVPMATNQGCKGLIPGPKVLAEFLRYVLLASVDELNALGSGTTFKELSGSKVKDFRVPLPPLEEQKRIVAKLDEAAILHSALLELNANLEVETQSLRRVVIDSAITGSGVETPLADLCNVFVDGDWIESKDQSASGIRLVQTGNVGHGYFKPNDERARFISEETFVRLRCTEVLPGDCLVSRLPEPIGRACIVPDIGDRMITAVDCTLIRPTPKLLAEYFVYVTQTSEYSRQVQERSTGTTRTRISRKNLGQILIPVPSIEQQEAIVRRLNALDERLSVLAGISQARMERAGDFMPQMLTHLMEQGQ